MPQSNSFVVGVTTCGASVVSGALVFKLQATHGLPLEMTIDMIYGMGAAISWLDFVSTALASGWTQKRIMNRLNEALIDWPNERQNILPRLAAFFQGPTP